MKKMNDAERERLFKELEGNQYILRKRVKVGINQGQLFVRIPQKISEEFGITQTSNVEFVFMKENDKKELKLEVIE